MASEKASFYSRDTAAVTSDLTIVGQTKYMGEERRRTDRRQLMERRAEVRFELSNRDRRELAGRREGDLAPIFW